MTEQLLSVACKCLKVVDSKRRYCSRCLQYVCQNHQSVNSHECQGFDNRPICEMHNATWLNSEKCRFCATRLCTECARDFRCGMCSTYLCFLHTRRCDECKRFFCGSKCKEGKLNHCIKCKRQYCPSCEIPEFCVRPCRAIGLWHCSRCKCEEACALAKKLRFKRRRAAWVKRAAPRQRERRSIVTNNLSA
jgi:hypothetical protein